MPAKLVVPRSTALEGKQQWTVSFTLDPWYLFEREG